MKKIFAVLLAGMLVLAGSPIVSASSLVGSDGKVVEAELCAQVENKVQTATGDTVTVTVSSAGSISPTAIRTAHSAAGEKALTLRFDTLTANGNKTQGRLYLQPAALTKRKSSVKLGVYTDSESVAAVKTKMENRYTNKMVLVHMEHTGTLTAEAKVMARVNLDTLNKDNLQFYVYNAKKDTLTQIVSARYSVSKQFVTFYTRQAGDIVITDSQLTERGGSQSFSFTVALDDAARSSVGGASPAAGTGQSEQSAINERAFARQVFALVNKERAKAGLYEVSWSEELYECAVIRARELSIKFGHERPYTPTVDRGGWPANTNGKGIYNAPSVADELGISYSWIMENAGGGYRTPEAAVKAWMNSSGHRANILRETHEVCGVAVYAVPAGSGDPVGYGTYWALLLDGSY